MVRAWNSRRPVHRPEADAEYTVPAAEDDAGHGGADPLLIDEFVRFAREGGVTDTSPVAAPMAVAAGARATESRRAGGTPREIEPPDPEPAAYVERGRTRPGRTSGHPGPGRTSGHPRDRTVR